MATCQWQKETKEIIFLVTVLLILLTVLSSGLYYCFLYYTENIAKDIVIFENINTRTVQKFFKYGKNL